MHLRCAQHVLEQAHLLFAGFLLEEVNDVSEIGLLPSHLFYVVDVLERDTDSFGSLFLHGPELLHLIDQVIYILLEPLYHEFEDRALQCQHQLVDIVSQIEDLRCCALALGVYRFFCLANFFVRGLL